MDELRVFESFAGLGTQRMALRNLKIPHKVVAISEIDKDVLISYDAIHSDGRDIDIPSFKEMYDYLESKNIGYDFKKKKVVLPKNEEYLKKIYVAHIRSNNLGDISKVKADGIPDHDLFTYSFPCTDVSISGKKQGVEEGSGTRSSYLWECKKVIEGKKPKYLMMENVDNLVNPKFKPYFDEWWEYLKTQGYSNYWDVLDAQYFDVAQRRKRVFLISVLGDEKFEFPKELNVRTSIKDFLEPEVTDEWYYQSALHVGKQNCSVGNTIDIAYKDRILKGICNENYVQWDVSGKGYKSQVDRAFYVNGVLGTIPYHRTETKVKILLENGQVRYPTELEVWRLMGISDSDFQKAKNAGVSRKNLYEQAGNAIVVNVLEAIFKEMFLAAEIGRVRGYYTYEDDLELNVNEKGV